MYLPGHVPHWIQVRKSREDTDNPPLVCSLIDWKPDGIMRIVLGGQIIRLWHHDPRRVKVVVAASKGLFAYQKRWRLLYTGSGHHLDVADPPEKHVPCLVDEETGEPRESPSNVVILRPRWLPPSSPW